MLLDTGARQQESLRQHPAMIEMQQFPFPLTGIITAVKYSNSRDNVSKQTLADVMLHYGYGAIIDVPIAVGKSNMVAGEEWTPDTGDMVVVQFIAGMWTRPMITGYCPLPDNFIQAEKEESPADTRRYHFRCNKTDVTIDKDGNRTTYVVGNDIIDIDGSARIKVYAGDYSIETLDGDIKITANKNMNVIVEGDCNARIMGNVNITTIGNTTINTTGDTKIRSKGDLSLISLGNSKIIALKALSIKATGATKIVSQSDVNVTALNGINFDGKGVGKAFGVVTQKSMCAFTGSPHCDYSLSVKAS